LTRKNEDGPLAVSPLKKNGQIVTKLSRGARERPTGKKSKKPETKEKFRRKMVNHTQKNVQNSLWCCNRRKRCSAILSGHRKTPGERGKGHVSTG